MGRRDYATQKGPQMIAVRRMLTRLAEPAGRVNDKVRPGPDFAGVGCALFYFSTKARSIT